MTLIMKTTKQTTPTSQEQTEAKAEVIKLGLDIHKNEYVVVRQSDAQAPKGSKGSVHANSHYLVDLI